MSTSLRRRLPFFVCLAVLCAAVASTDLAHAQDVELAWIPPNAGVVAGYNVYIAPTGSGPIVAAPIDVGRPTVDVAGVARARISVAPSASLSIEMTAYDSSRRESARSNRVTLTRASEFLEAPIWSTTFSSAPIGANAPGFTGSTFAVTEFPAGNRVLGLPGTTGYPVARFLAASSRTWKPYELSGRMYIQSGVRLAGVAVRVAPVERDGNPFQVGFRLGGDSTGRFSVVSNDPSVALRCASSASTGVTAQTLRWYRFKVRYTEPNDRSRVRAKVWLDGAAEPSAWQVDCSAPSVPTVDSGIFALYRSGPGAIFWDDLGVRPVGGWWSPAPYL
jgi:hypothetical protein